MLANSITMVGEKYFNNNTSILNKLRFNVDLNDSLANDCIDPCRDTENK